MARKTRLVVLNDEYLDGISAVNVADVDEFTGPTARRMPVELLDAYEEAWAAMRRVEKQLLQAWGALADVKNPHHKDEPAGRGQDGGGANG